MFNVYEGVCILDITPVKGLKFELLQSIVV